jgi:hypothetical protein
MYIFTLLCRGFRRSPPAPPPRPPISGAVPAGQCSPLKTSADLYLYSLRRSPSPPSHTPTMCCMHVAWGGRHPPPTPSLHTQCQGQCSLIYRCTGTEIRSYYSITGISCCCLYIHDFVRRLDWTRLLRRDRQKRRKTDRDRHRD